ncbi:MAG: hypothetical protein K2K58_03670, partial [Muribaculaceae bacterium]|nr:hypothetical protein [Muribaculaceae bacterium]
MQRVTTGLKPKTSFYSDPTPEAIFGHGFADLIDSYNWEETVEQVVNSSLNDVDRVLDKARSQSGRLSPEEFGTLIS